MKRPILEQAVAPLVAWSRTGVTSPQRRPVDRIDLRAHLDAIERAVLIVALDRTRDNQTHAAALLAISRRTLIIKLEKHGLKPAPNARAPRFRRRDRRAPPPGGRRSGAMP